jgi:hypothetical protein
LIDSKLIKHAIPFAFNKRKQDIVWHWIFDVIGAAIVYMAGHAVGWKRGWKCGYNDEDWKYKTQNQSILKDE